MVFVYVKYLILYAKYIILYVKYIIFAFGTSQPLSFGLPFLRTIYAFFSNLAFSVVFGEALLPKGAY